MALTRKLTIETTERPRSFSVARPITWLSKLSSRGLQSDTNFRLSITKVTIIYILIRLRQITKWLTRQGINDKYKYLRITQSLFTNIFTHLIQH